MMGVFRVNGVTYDYEGRRPEIKVCANGVVQFDGKTVKPRPVPPPQPMKKQQGE